MTKVAATLLKGRKAVGKAKLAKLAKNGTLKFKFKKKLKKGSYVFTMTAKDGSGNTVGLKTKLKVGK